MQFFTSTVISGWVDVSIMCWKKVKGHWLWQFDLFNIFFPWFCPVSLCYAYLLGGWSLLLLAEQIVSPFYYLHIAHFLNALFEQHVLGSSTYFFYYSLCTVLLYLLVREGSAKLSLKKHLSSCGKLWKYMWIGSILYMKDIFYYIWQIRASFLVCCIFYTLKSVHSLHESEKSEMYWSFYLSMDDTETNTHSSNDLFCLFVCFTIYPTL